MRKPTFLAQDYWIKHRHQINIYAIQIHQIEAIFQTEMESMYDKGSQSSQIVFTDPQSSTLSRHNKTLVISYQSTQTHNILLT